MTIPAAYNLSDIQHILAFSGEDALIFLQGQLTCDVTLANEENSLLGALCNPKGRAISLLYLFKRNGIYYMLVPSDLSDDLLKRLKMFVFRSNVNIKNVTDEFVTLGCLTNEVITGNSCFASIAIQQDSNISIKLMTKEGFQESIDDALDSISDQTHQWYLQLIKAGVPRVNKQTTEMFVPQMLNLELLNGISFTKGCYTGQEIIARMHYKGTLKRRMYVFNSSKAIEPGADLLVKDNNNSLGNIVDCQAIDANNYCGTVVLKSANVSSSPLELIDGSIISIKQPPYGLNLEA